MCIRFFVGSMLAGELTGLLDEIVRNDVHRGFLYRREMLRTKDFCRLDSIIIREPGAVVICRR